MPGSREEDLLRNTAILHFLPQNYLPLRMRGHEIYNFSSPYPTDATYQFGNRDPVINRQCMMHDGAIGHLRDLGNL